MSIDGALARFCSALPKAELHAHLNGSVSLSTIHKLVTLKKTKNPYYPGLTAEEKAAVQSINSFNINEVFKIFPVIQKLTDSADAVKLATKEVLREFAEDNVKFVELRSTPRAHPESGFRKEDYVEAILDGIRESASVVVCRLLLSIDRRQTETEASDTVTLAARFCSGPDPLLVGIDLSGDPGHDARKFLPALRRAKMLGLKISVHVAECQMTESLLETLDLLELPPDRIGHGTFLRPEVGGSAVYVQKVLRDKIPLELCLSSNVLCKTVASFEDHHLGFWLGKNHPLVLCTDDKGVFRTSLSMEYVQAAEAFRLDQRALMQLARQSLACAFLPAARKNQLAEHWTQFAVQMDMEISNRLF